MIEQSGMPSRPGKLPPSPIWLARFGDGLRKLFPERQIYVRSEGRVQFFTFGPRLQMGSAAIASIALAWVAFSTVTVVFKDRILAAQDHRFQQMQSAFEARMTDLQVSYDALEERAAGAQSDADRTVTRLSGVQGKFAAQIGPARPERPDTASAPARMGSQIGIVRHALNWMLSDHRVPSLSIRSPFVGRILADARKLGELGQDATGTMVRIGQQSQTSVAKQRALIASTGLNADAFLQRLRGSEGVGGPEIPLDEVRLDGISDRAFTQAYLRAEADADALATIQQAVLHLPVAKPVAARVERSSGFGPRLDPFSGRYAFHPGVDFAGPAGTPVLATGGGRVTFAGRDGGYGNMVELDHGEGLRTRYAHLLSVSVALGAWVAKGSVVGHMGSTGRSTGPHVHYEVWFDNVVRNPDGFLRLGQLERDLVR